MIIYNLIFFPLEFSKQFSNNNKFKKGPKSAYKGSDNFNRAEKTAPATEQATEENITRAEKKLVEEDK